MLACFFYTFLGFDGGLHEGCTSLFESQGSEVVMEDCVIEISPDNSGLNKNVASGPDGGSVSRPSSPHDVYDVDDDDFVTPCPLGVHQLVVLLWMRLKYFRKRGQVRGLLS